MDAQQMGGKHYDLHSMYGWWQSKITREAMNDIFPDERSFLLTRSTFLGSGKFAAHWTGDNFSIWTNVKYSIIGMLEFNHFGIPMVGADICGFTGTPSEELCARWQLVGSFYPFSRNHNYNQSPDQDPGVWPSVAYNTRKALLIRYRLLPYLYSLFARHSLSGNPVVKGLWMEFPADQTALTVDEQFLWGSSFMISPAIYQGQTNVTVYFPEGLWYDYFSRTRVPFASQSLGTLDCPIDCIPLHLRGGSVLAAQKAEVTTKASRRNNFELIVVLDENESARGELFWDDGETKDENLLLFSHLEFAVVEGSQRLQTDLRVANFAALSNWYFEKIEVWGLNRPIAGLNFDNGASCFWQQDIDFNLDIDCGTQINAASLNWSFTWIG